MSNQFVSPNWHVLLIHYPIAFLFAGFLIEFFSFMWPRGTFRIAGRWLILLGALCSLPALTAGVFAFRSVVSPEMSGPAWSDVKRASPWTLTQWAMMTRHIWLNSAGVGLALLGVITWLAASDNWRRRLHWPVMLLIAASVAAFSVGAWYGGESVYRHGVAVEPAAAISAVDRSQMPPKGDLAVAIADRAIQSAAPACAASECDSTDSAPADAPQEPAAKTKSDEKAKSDPPASELAPLQTIEPPPAPPEDTPPATAPAESTAPTSAPSESTLPATAPASAEAPSSVAGLPATIPAEAPSSPTTPPASAPTETAAPVIAPSTPASAESAATPPPDTTPPAPAPPAVTAPDAAPPLATPPTATVPDSTPPSAPAVPAAPAPGTTTPLIPAEVSSHHPSMTLSIAGHDIKWYVPPLELHVVLAGFAVALSLAALGLTIRRWEWPSPPPIEDSPGAETGPSAAEAFTALDPQTSDRSDLDRPFVERPLGTEMIVAAASGPIVYPGRFWLLTALLVLLTAGAGLWSVIDVFTGNALTNNWRMIQKPDFRRLFLHAIFGVTLLVLPLILSLLVRFGRKQRGFSAFFLLLLVVVVALQLWLGIALLFDGHEGPLFHFNRP